jgi:hypothetical protein
VKQREHGGIGAETACGRHDSALFLRYCRDLTDGSRRPLILSVHEQVADLWQEYVPKYLEFPAVNVMSVGELGF